MKIYRLYTIHQENRIDITRSTLPATCFSFDTTGDPEYTDYTSLDEAMNSIRYQVADITYYRNVLPLVLIRANVITELEAVSDEDGDIIDYDDCGDAFISALPDEITLGSDTYSLNLDTYERIDDEE